MPGHRSGLGSLIVVGLLFGAPPALAHHAKQLPEGIVSVDTRSRAELQELMRAGYRAEIPWDEAFGEFVDVDAYVPNLTVDEVYDYVQDITNLKYWTMSEYDPQPMGTLDGRNRYSALENFPPFGTIYLTEEKHPGVKTVDWWVGQVPDDIWMHYYVRILDARRYVGKPGVIINWVNFGHRKFETNPDLYQGFRGMRIAHGIERDNLIKILHWRAAGNTGPITVDVMFQLGLVNAHTCNFDFMSIWNMIMGSIAETVRWEDLYGGFISSHFYVPDVPADQVWGYLSNVRNMNDWTVSIRSVLPHRDDFVALEALSPVGILLADTDVDERTRTLDVRMASTRYLYLSGAEKWMTSSFRVIDAMDAVGKPGTVVVWTTFHHALYDALPQLAEEWKYVPVRNRYAAENMKLLLAQP